MHWEFKKKHYGRSLLNHWGKGCFKAYSAGSHPKEEVNPSVIKVLNDAKIALPEDLEPKSWDEFAKDGASKIDFVITVCDKANGEQCPIWPGQPINAHWGVEDPHSDDGDLKEYKDVLRILSTRINLFTLLPHKKLSRVKLQQELDEIGLNSI
ncbi:MAG: arsenate reductase (thioredoxin) [Thiomicrorhabdus sp.]|nr:MAG: arsenate reductase (thioredoxin) [Thiomicrorhabdus sp.]